MSRPSANEDLALNSNIYLTSSSETFSTRTGAVLRTFLTTKSPSGSPHAAALFAAPLIAALLIVGSAERAQAQLFPWGGWGNSNWQQKPRRKRRPRSHYVEPKVFKNKYPIPETSGGPLLLVVSLPDQNVTVYDGTKKLITAPISSGMRGHATPTGIFSILEKNRHHYSNLYGGAPMPFMQRVTNSGVALHAGNLPGYPASHGCIRLPYSFARNLFGATNVGARVIVTDHDVAPVAFSSPRLIAPLPPEEFAEKAAVERVAKVEPVSGTKEEFDAVMAGLRPDAADDETQSRETAAAARGLKMQRLATAITDAEDGVKAAIERAENAKEAESEARKALSDARREHRSLARTAKKAKFAATKAQKQFTSLTRKLTELDAENISREDLDEKLELELEEEEKLLAIVDRAAVAKSAAKAQAKVVKTADETFKAAKQARADAREGIKTAKQAVVEAKAALASAKVIEERRDYPVSIFVSRKTGRLIAKLGFAEVINVPVEIADPDTPIGTHVFTATNYTDGERALDWTVATVRPSTSSRPPRRRRRDDEEFVEHADGTIDANTALARVEIPEKTRQQLAELIKPRSSLIISDYGLSRETSSRTEFVIEPWRVRGY